MKNKYLKTLTDGVVTENPLFRLVLGACPALAVSSAVANGFWMGLMVIFVLTFSNMLISALRNFIPDKIRIPCYIVIIATFVTIVDLLMAAYMHEMHKTLGIFIPLIVVNCIILARAESFASKNSILHSAVDGIGMGLGFMAALMIVATFREVLGNGTFFNIRVLPAGFPVAKVMVEAPGAFITLGLVLGLINLITARSKTA